MSYISEVSLRHLKEYREIFEIINKYNKIAIFRHIHPDFDALGSQWALKEFLSSNYMDKDIKVLGDNDDELTPRLFPKSMNTQNVWFEEPFLAIVLDTPNLRRISDPRFKKADYIIKIDHHPFIEDFKGIECIDISLSSCAELLSNLLISYKLPISKECAKYLYVGIAGDSGRFEYQNTSSHTFDICSYLLSKNINLPEIYHNMYLRSENDLKVITYILSNYKVSPHGVAYFLLDRKTLNNLHINTNKGKDFINLFKYIDGIKIWVAITEDMKEDNCYRVSLRSENISIREIANKYRGGGHDFASGAKLISIKEIDDLILDLDKLI